MLKDTKNEIALELNARGVLSKGKCQGEKGGGYNGYGWSIHTYMGVLDESTHIKNLPETKRIPHSLYLMRQTKKCILLKMQK